MCELKYNHNIYKYNISDKDPRRCQLIVNSLSTKRRKVDKSGDKSQKAKSQKCPIYAGLRHFTRCKNKIIAALITRRSLVQIQLPQPRILGTSEVFGGAFFLPKTGSLSTHCQQLQKNKRAAAFLMSVTLSFFTLRCAFFWVYSLMVFLLILV